MGSVKIEDDGFEDHSKTIEPLSPDEIQAFMYKQHAERISDTDLLKATERRLRTMQDLIKYLSLVPIGVGDRSRRIDLDLRIKLYHERGCICEICRTKLEITDIELHHLNYFKGDDPDYLMAVCKPCHRVINTLTGVVSWFEIKTQASESQSINPEDEGTTAIRKGVVGERPAYLDLFSEEDKVQNIDQ